ncbi:MAG: hypothetical protein Roseis2KO_36200 [Roseivirga sp.]
MKLIIEFPLYIVSSYNGISNLDETLDDNISYLIGKYCYDHNIGFRILELTIADPEPKVHDGLIRYQVELEINPDEFKTAWVLDELKTNGFEKGLTIKREDRTVLYSDEFSADIAW